MCGQTAPVRRTIAGRELLPSARVKARKCPLVAGQLAGCCPLARLFKWPGRPVRSALSPEAKRNTSAGRESRRALDKIEVSSSASGKLCVSYFFGRQTSAQLAWPANVLAVVGGLLCFALLCHAMPCACVLHLETKSGVPPSHRRSVFAAAAETMHNASHCDREEIRASHAAAVAEAEAEAVAATYGMQQIVRFARSLDKQWTERARLAHGECHCNNLATAKLLSTLTNWSERSSVFQSFPRVCACDFSIGTKLGNHFKHKAHRRPPATHCLCAAVCEFASSPQLESSGDPVRTFRNVIAHHEMGRTDEQTRSTYRRLGVAVLARQVHVQLELVLVLYVAVAGFAAAQGVDAPEEGPLGFDVHHHFCVRALERNVVAESVRVTILVVVRARGCDLQIRWHAIDGLARGPKGRNRGQGRRCGAYGDVARHTNGAAASVVVVVGAYHHWPRHRTTTTAAAAAGWRNCDVRGKAPARRGLLAGQVRDLDVGRDLAVRGARRAGQEGRGQPNGRGRAHDGRQRGSRTPAYESFHVA
ncbi:Hypothetical predicted protein [Olea europaea subsp. europaea]|uniref:Uncharacterized protein n=1 Tax=Olea europaea subsp. europaea TaxID=158383 RepID=A0A8S0TRH5_OLEEU|nr:Hypothetical predicted protein [Olea europaea subsp. europaea]